MHYVIIGNSVAAAGAIEGIRQFDRTGSITLFSDEPCHIYSRPLISYYLAGKVEAEQMKYRPDDYYLKYEVTARLGEKVMQVDTERCQLVLASGERVGYDRLLIASGGKPIVPRIAGLDKENVHTFLKWEEVKVIKAKTSPGKKIVILGAGLIGLKAAEGFIEAGCQVAVIDLANRVLSAILDSATAAIVQRHLEKQEISFYLANTVERVIGNEWVTGVLLQDGTELPCDLLIVAIGVVPNTELLGSGSEIETNRGVLVDQRLETSVAGVFAAGDVSEGLELLSGVKRVLPILPNAYRQGEVAGVNMAGGAARFAGGLPMNSIGFFGMSIVTAGYAVPQGEEYWETLEFGDEEKQEVRKILLCKNRIQGLIFINLIDRAGVYHWLLEGQVDVTPFKDKLLSTDFGYVYLPTKLRWEKLGREA